MGNVEAMQGKKSVSQNTGGDGGAQATNRLSVPAVIRILSHTRYGLHFGSLFSILTVQPLGNSAIDSRFRKAAWHDIPVELKLEVLSYVAPNLSPAQLIRVSSYAGDITTLPPLGQLPNPGQLQPSIHTLRCSWLFRVECDYFDPTIRT